MQKHDTITGPGILISMLKGLDQCFVLLTKVTGDRRSIVEIQQAPNRKVGRNEQ